MTANAREAIAAFVENNSPRLQHLLDRIESEDGAQAAFDCIYKLIEFHVPKLSRADMTHDVAPEGELSRLMREINGETAGLPAPAKTGG